MATVADVMVEVLKEEKVTTVFGIPSIHNLALYEALRQEPSIRHILCRQETTAAHMADGYARACQSTSVVISSTGPGTGYMVPALHEAWGSCSPLLMITTNIPAGQIGRGLGALHELERQAQIFKSVTKAVFVLDQGERVRAMTRQALRTTVSGRPGPVCLEIPTDILGETWAEGFEEESGAGEQPGTAGDMDKACSLLEHARQPLIITGISALRAGLGPEIKTLSETLVAPVLTTTQGKGILPEDHPHAFGNAARKGPVSEMVGSCDLVLAVGTRLREVDTRRRGLSLSRLIHVDWDERWIGRNYPTEVPLTGDIREITKKISRAARPGAFCEQRREWIRAAGRKVKQDRDRIRKDRVELHYLEVIRDILPRESMLVTDSTVLGYWSEYFYSSYMPGGMITPRGSSIIGFGFPAAVGARLARRDLAVVAVVGDGGFLYGAQELATCARHGIGLPVILVNDDAFGVIGYLQRALFGRDHEYRLKNPDFRTLAKAYGAESISVDSTAGLEEALRRALASETLWLIELRKAFPEPPYEKY
jgi:acetolactate synthase-1/2/3 large subunit